MEENLFFDVPIIDMKKTGQRIATLREKSGMSVKDLQDIFGFATPQAIYKWQNGKAMPTIDNLALLSRIFGVKMEDIIVFKKK